jgi:hypothetical protein
MALQHLKTENARIRSGYKDVKHSEGPANCIKPAALAITTPPVRDFPQGFDIVTNTPFIPWQKMHQTVVVKYGSSFNHNKTDYRPLSNNLNLYVEKLGDISESIDVEPDYRICTPPMAMKKIRVKIKCIGKITPSPIVHSEWA